MAASFPISSNDGEIAVRNTSAANWNSRPSTRNRASVSRTAENWLMSRRASATTNFTVATTAPIMILLIAASMYSRFLAMGGATQVITDLLFSVSENPAVVLAIIFTVWVLLGMFIDSTSIILLTVPIFAPVATTLGVDPLAFAIFGILVIEAGLLTPPFGILVFTVKAAVPDAGVTLGDIFRGAIPFWILILGVAIMVLVWPELSTWLPYTFM